MKIASVIGLLVCCSVIKAQKPNFSIPAKPKLIAAEKIIPLPPELDEISGMIRTDSGFLAIKDGGTYKANHLFRIDSSGNILSSIQLPATNTDWEEICENNQYIFVGDFGNNFGNRNTLRILKIPKDSLLNSTNRPLEFQIGDNTAVNKKKWLTNYDFEAMTATSDTLLLFSKSKSDRRCRIYQLSLSKPFQILTATGSVKLKFWVTGATLINPDEDKKHVMLTGYFPAGRNKLTPWLACIETSNSGKQPKMLWQKKISINGHTQIESVCMDKTGRIWLSSESIKGLAARLILVNLQSQ